MADAFNTTQARIPRARLAGDPPDLLISPRVGQIGWFDFHRADDLIAHGARAAERAIESIQEAIGILVPPSADAGALGDTDKSAEEEIRSGSLDVVPQRFLLGLVCLDPT